MSKKGLKKAFFNQIAIGLLLQPQMQYRANKPPIMQNVEESIIGTQEQNTTPPVVNQRAYYVLQLALWYEVKSLVDDYAEEDQDFFTKHLRTGYGKTAQGEEYYTGLYWYERIDKQDHCTPLEARKDNKEHFRTLTIQELEARMLEEYINFSLSKYDFVDREWNDNPLTDREIAMLNRKQEQSTSKPLNKKDFPQGIQLLAKQNMLEWLPSANAYILPVSAKGKHKGEYKPKAEALLKEKNIKPEWERWSKEGYIVKRGGEKYARQGLTGVLDTF